MEQFNYKNLQTILGEKVTIVDNEKNEIEFTLSEVNTGIEHSEKREVFSAVLTCENKPELPQGTYELNHKLFGSLPLFVCPNSETEYEIIINREIV
ncbi:DUF6916 family protein [Aliikangiella sp. IMCC44359]|uniref:DUF6916 family protein n=1 Tax=Aliikangiella sp. IMCC44359 TaxID=3459125 RepID=UPI00403A8A2B